MAEATNPAYSNPKPNHFTTVTPLLIVGVNVLLSQLKGRNQSNLQRQIIKKSKIGLIKLKSCYILMFVCAQREIDSGPACSRVLKKYVF